VREIDDAVQLSALTQGHGAFAHPGELLGPVVADHAHELRREPGVDVGEAAVVGRATNLGGLHGSQVAVAGDDDLDGAAGAATILPGGHQAGVLGELLLDDRPRLGSGLDVDVEAESALVPAVDGAAVLADDLGQRREVVALEGALGVGRVVTDEQLTGDEPHVGLDARESVRERVEQRTRVLVVVVGVGALQGLHVVRTA